MFLVLLLLLLVGATLHTVASGRRSRRAVAELFLRGAAPDRHRGRRRHAVTTRRAARASRTAGAVLVGLILLASTPGAGAAQGPAARIDLLLPGAELVASDLPADAPGRWWVLDRAEDGAVLAPTDVVIAPFRDGCVDEAQDQQSGRRVTVPGARAPIALLRGLPDLRRGPLPTIFLWDGMSDAADSVELRWQQHRTILRHVADGGRYRVEWVVDGVPHPLHENEWHGDGVWAVRWVGDLNGDGALDVLLDASHKYSVHTTRLFVSDARAGRPIPREVATFTHTAC